MHDMSKREEVLRLAEKITEGKAQLLNRNQVSVFVCNIIKNRTKTGQTRREMHNAMSQLRHTCVLS